MAISSNFRRKTRSKHSKEFESDKESQSDAIEDILSVGNSESCESSESGQSSQSQAIRVPNQIRKEGIKNREEIEDEEDSSINSSTTNNNSKSKSKRLLEVLRQPKSIKDPSQEESNDGDQRDEKNEKVDQNTLLGDSDNIPHEKINSYELNPNNKTNTSNNDNNNSNSNCNNIPDQGHTGFYRIPQPWYQGHITPQMQSGSTQMQMMPQSYYNIYPQQMPAPQQRTAGHQTQDTHQNPSEDFSAFPIENSNQNPREPTQAMQGLTGNVTTLPNAPKLKKEGVIITYKSWIRFQKEVEIYRNTYNVNLHIATCIGDEERMIIRNAYCDAMGWLRWKWPPNQFFSKLQNTEAKEADQIVETAIRKMNNRLKSSLPEKLKSISMELECDPSNVEKSLQNISKYIDVVADLHNREGLPQSEATFKSIFSGIQPKEWSESLYKAQKDQIESVDKVLTILEGEVKRKREAWEELQEFFDVQGNHNLSILKTSTKTGKGYAEKKAEPSRSEPSKSEPQRSGSSKPDKKDSSKQNDIIKPRIKVEALKNIKSIADLKPENYDQVLKELRQSCFKCGSYTHCSRDCRSPKSKENNPIGALYKKMHKIITGIEEKDKPKGVYAISEKNQTFKSEAFQRASLIISDYKVENQKEIIAKGIIVLIDTGNQTGSTFISLKLAKKCAEANKNIVLWKQEERRSQPLDQSFKKYTCGSISGVEIQLDTYSKTRLPINFIIDESLDEPHHPDVIISDQDSIRLGLYPIIFGRLASEQNDYTYEEELVEGPETFPLENEPLYPPKKPRESTRLEPNKIISKSLYSLKGDLATADHEVFPEIPTESIPLEISERDPSVVNPKLKYAKEIWNLLEKHWKLFIGLRKDSKGKHVFSKLAPYKLKLKPGAHYKGSCPRNYPQNQLRAMEIELNRLEKAGIIERTYRPLASSAILMVIDWKKSKPNEPVFRLCIDYKLLNDQLEDVAGATVNPETTLQRIGGKPYLASFDMTRSFYQREVSNEVIGIDPITKLDLTSRDLTAMASPFGTYRWISSPFGTKTQPRSWQLVMMQLFSHLRLPKAGAEPNRRAGIEIYIDNFFVWAETEEAFLDIIRKTLEIFSEAGIALNMNETVIGHRNIQCLGFVVDGEGFSPLPKHLKAIEELDSPKTEKQARHVLGMANFLKKHCPQMGSITAPMYDCLRGKFAWTDQAEIAFHRLKDEIANAQKRFFLKDITSITPLLVRTDASCTGVGAGLFQIIEGEEKLISSISHKFSTAASKWSTPEQECFAMIYALHEYRGYLLGHHFIVETDHRNLLWLRGSVMNEKCNRKIIRWYLSTLEFDFEIKHIPGKDNIWADALSRLYAILPSIKELSDRVNNINEEEEMDVSPEHLKLFYDYHNYLKDGHLGIEATINLMERKGVHITSRLRSDIAKLISNCGACKKGRPHTSKAPTITMKTIAGQHPWQILEVDYIYVSEDNKGNKYICVMIDTFTRFVQLEAVPEKSGEIFAGILMKLYSNFGLPKFLRHDGGTEFDNEVIKTINQILKIKDHTTTPYRYQSHGIVERANQKCLRHLRLLCHRLHKKTEWTSLLPLVQHVVNSVPSTITGFAPKDLLLGPFSQNDNDDNLWPIGETEKIIDIPEYVKEVIEVQEQLVKQARSNNIDYIKTMDQEAKDKGIDRTATKYKVNDLVYTTRRRFEKQADKLSPLLFGPFKVIKVIENESRYTLQSLISEEHTFEVHIADLREFQHNKSDESPEMLARIDNEETLVLQVLDHKLGKNDDGTNNLQLNEFLLLFEDGDIKWIPHREARNVDLVIDYAKKHDKLKAKYQRQQANEDITDSIAPARMDLSRPSAQTKHNTRNRSK
jgi:hypothetical protein